MSSIKQLAYWKTYFTPNRYSNDLIPDQTGKVAIVTGANTGLGYATMVALAGHGAHVFLACRSEERALHAVEKAKQEIKEKYPRAPAPNLEFLELDLNDMSKCKKAANEFLNKGLPLHLLVNNSGIMTTPFALSADGIEQQFAVNHMGHFVFTTALLDRIKESQPSRIVVLSSHSHERPVEGGIDFDTLNDEKMSTIVSRYGRSKLANVLFGKALARRFADTQVYVNIVHPGFVATELQRHNKELFGPVVLRVLEAITAVMAMTPEVGALTQLYVATSPEIVNKDIRGRYFVPIANEIQPSAYAQDEELQEKLWAFSEKLVIEKVRA
ncbi:hypothetical protein BC939DRAFT_403561 [Gamsiella multidivaricata]|uniref:uncharacterized protein n=1 Tax=Gamsiella multidivaricata TaxID=101098 RepID=UPI0022208707|nr:uncharacterized protein BC939DRAFT_403561 [Gamsiella multidivaricata]KAG0348398.1 hypothetical protein BGZ54_004627 [Gamsiella multidivaricata]KAI7816638.1 hypothetical protein BC939DRAFT_403561 [Gamsiella multidivaricata]